MTTFTQHSHPGKLHSASAYTERRELLTLNATPARLAIGAMDAQQTPPGQPSAGRG